MRIPLDFTRLVLLGSLSTLAACASAPRAPALPAAWSATTEGCQVWNRTPSGGSETVSWDGACVSGYADGPGTLTWFQNGSYSQRFVGAMRAGKRQGIGEYYWASGDRFQGAFDNDSRTGKGSYTWNNGDQYSGDFVDGQRTGYGIYTFASGNRFEGDQRNGSFINGNLTAADGEAIAKYVDGNRIALRYEPTQASGQASSGGSGFGAVLGAIAQGLAAAGGKNSAQLQAVASVMNSSAGSGGGAAQTYSAPNTAAGGNATSGTSSTDTQPMVNNCLSLTRSHKYSMRINNSCGFEVSMIYCYTSISNAAPLGFDVASNACTRYRTNASANVVVGASSFIEVNAPDNTNPVEFIACKSANDGYPEKLRYDGSKLNGQCHYRQTTAGNGPRSFGAVR